MSENSISFSSEYYSPSEVAHRLEEYAKASGQKIDTVKSAFYRRVKSGVIGSIPLKRKSRERTQGYVLVDVDRFLRGELIDGRRRQDSSQALIIDSALEKPAVSLLDRNDTPFLYTMESEVLGGIEGALSPIALQQWQNANSNICYIMHNPENRHDTWGMFVVLPLQENLIVQVLKGDVNINFVPPKDILPYQSGDYSCYVASFSVRPERQKYALQLVQAMLNYWLTLPPNVVVATLYTSVSSKKNSSLHRLVRDLYFSRRYDIAPEAWDLRIKEDWQPSPIVDKYKRDKHMVMVMSRREAFKIAPTTHFSRASYDDLPATLDVDETLFGPYDMPIDEIVALRKTWLDAEPESFYVLKKEGKVVGYHSMLALPQHKIEAILREEQRPKDIRSDEIRRFDSEQELDVYIIVTGIRRSLDGRAIEGREKGAYASSLIRGITRQFQELGERGVSIRSIYARSRTPDGIKFIEDLGFEELSYSPIHGKRLFKLSVSTAEGGFIQSYKKALEKYQATHSIKSNT